MEEKDLGIGERRDRGRGGTVDGGGARAGLTGVGTFGEEKPSVEGDMKRRRRQIFDQKKFDRLFSIIAHSQSFILPYLLTHPKLRRWVLCRGLD